MSLSGRRRRFRPDWAVVVAAVFLVALIAAAVFADHVAPYGMNQQDLAKVLRPPVWLEGGTDAHLLGTDRLGRDVLTEIIFGARISLMVGLGAVLIGLVIGVPLGMVAGYFRGRVDQVISRAIDVQMSLPLILLALLLVAILGPGRNNVILIQGLASWLIYARLARAQVMVEKERPYIEASRALGSRIARIFGRHLLPNILTPIVAVSTLEIGRNIITETTLSFLGVGVTPPDASWGRMVADGRDVIFFAWWVPSFPGLAITLTVIAFALLGDWLRDQLDHRR